MPRSQNYIRGQKGEGYENYATISELAKLIGVSRQHLKVMVKEGKIEPPAHTTSKGWRLWSPEQTRRIIADRIARIESLRHTRRR